MAVCSTVLPSANADLCSPNTNYGQISTLLFTRLGDGLTDWTDDAEWAGRIDNDAALAAPPALAAIRQLFGIGALDAPDRPEIEISKRRRVFGDPEFTMSFEVDDTGDINWNNFMKGLPAGGQVYSVWFGTEQRLFGGDEGLTATLVANPSIPQSKDELMKIIITVTWTGTIPEVVDNPLV